jgi:hypothetical protein
MIEQTEIVVNIWFYVDIASNLCYAYGIKAYHLDGNDDEKLAVLAILAETDYVTVPKRALPDDMATVFSNQEIKGSIIVGEIQNCLIANIDYFTNSIEDDLPLLNKHTDGSLIAVRQKISLSPLYASTIIMENEIGISKPFTSAINRAWFTSERDRIKKIS